jgi:fructose-1,6-bisphosphatase/inositol monophosphatase family enzyme
LTDDVAADLELAILAAREAGAVIMKSFRTEQEVTLKSPDQPLTQADLAADATLKRILLGNRLEYGWLSEETADNPERLKRRFVWIVDPIDGTRSYIAGYPEFAISIGLAENERALLGVVYNPASDEMYAARRGGGAWRVGGGALNVQRSGARSLRLHPRLQHGAVRRNPCARHRGHRPVRGDLGKRRRGRDAPHRSGHRRRRAALGAAAARGAEPDCRQPARHP